MSNNIDYTIQTFPWSRLLTTDIGKLGLQKHHIKSMIEIDVTDSRIKLNRKKSKSNNKVSFTSWILKCISQAVSENKQVHALRKGKNKLIVFNDIDISVIVEKNIDDVPVPIPLVIRNVNKKSITEIYLEIDKAKKQEIINENNYVLEQNKKKDSMKLFLILPQFIRLIIWKIILSNPHRLKNLMGTIIVTSVGMIGDVSGWAIPYSIHPLCFAIGSIIKKPGVKNGKIEIREYLNLTILMDHDVIDGAPALRFVSKLKELIENGYEL